MCVKYISVCIHARVEVTCVVLPLKYDDSLDLDRTSVNSLLYPVAMPTFV